MEEKQIYFTKYFFFHEREQIDFRAHYVIKSIQKIYLQLITTSNKRLKQYHVKQT